MRWWLGMVVALIGSAWLGPARAAADLAGMPPSEIEALQRRLNDAGCYRGPIDGQQGPGLARAIAVCPSQTPQLRIETGMHVAPIKRIGTDRACTLAVTGSTDKTARLWSLKDGRLIRTFRPPIEANQAGQIFAVALSPDGRFAAVAGGDGQFVAGGDNGVYVFDTASGTLVARVGRFDDLVDALSFSPDGRWLVAGLSDSHGIKVIDTARWAVVWQDKSYRGDSFGVTFGPDGRLYAAAIDGKVRRYGPGPGFRKEAGDQDRDRQRGGHRRDRSRRAACGRGLRGIDLRQGLRRPHLRVPLRGRNGGPRQW